MRRAGKLAGAIAGVVALTAAVLLGGGPVLRGLGLSEVGGLPAEPARASFPGVGKPAARAPVPDEVLVRFRSDARPEDRADARLSVDAELEQPLPVPGLQQLALEGEVSVQAAVERLERDDAVLYAEPNFYRRTAAPTADEYFKYLWGLENTGQPVAGLSGEPDADADLPEAWDETTGSPAVVTAVIDTGVDRTHPDLAPKIWRNPGESGNGRESNGVDDDGNGLVDDWRGWDWVAGDNDPADENGHGTHVAGTIGAREDDKGIVGVNRGGTVMPLRVLDSKGRGTVANLVEAYRYAARHGARVVNASLAGGMFSRAEHDAIRAASSTLFVAAAGNGGSDGIGDDNDAAPQYPCSHPLDNIVCVAATNQHDRLASFSNYGVVSVDLGAPGTNTLSTLPGNRFALFDGTSMATPHVAGVAGLVWSLRPEATVEEVKRAVLDGVDPNKSLAGKTVTGGRLNAHVAVAPGAGEVSVDDQPPGAEPPVQALVRGSRVEQGTVPVRLNWSASDDRTSAALLEYDLDREVDGAWSRIVDAIDRTSVTDSLSFRTAYRFRVRAYDEAGNVGSWRASPRFTPRAYQESRRAIDYRGSWKRLEQRSAHGGAVRSSRRAGSRATLGFKARNVGVVMPRRSTLGIAEVCLDPASSRQSCATVDLSASAGARTLVFARGGLDPGTRHAIRVEVVQGRVDLDAFVLLR